MTHLFVTRRSWSMPAGDSLNMPITVFILRAINILSVWTINSILSARCQWLNMSGIEIPTAR